MVNETDEQVANDLAEEEAARKNGEPVPGDKWRHTRPSENGRTVEIVTVDRAAGQVTVKGGNMGANRSGEKRPYGMSIRILKDRFERVDPPVEPPTPLAAPGI